MTLTPEQKSRRERDAKGLAAVLAKGSMDSVKAVLAAAGLPATIWVVEEGEYSDYRVVGVFSSEENAKLVADAINSPQDIGATVSEWPLDPAIAELRQGFSKYLVSMEKDGTVIGCEKREANHYGELANGMDLFRRNAMSANKDLLSVRTWAKDETYAIKIANEHRAQMIASGEWS